MLVLLYLYLSRIIVFILDFFEFTVGDKVDNSETELKLDYELRRPKIVTWQCKAIGPTFRGKYYIIIPEGIKINNFILLHESAHNKNNDNLIAFILIMLIGWLFWDNNILLLIAYIIIPLPFFRFVERWADKYAFENLDYKGQSDTMNMMLNQQLIGLVNRKSLFWGKLMFDEKGNNRFDIFHDSWSYRLSTLESYMKPVNIENLDKSIFIIKKIDNSL